MQSLTEKVFHLAPPGGLFDETVIRNLFPEHTTGAKKAIVHRAVQSGEVLRLKPGLFCLAKPFRRSHPHPFVLAATLHSPSHISLESALWHHGLIPEAIHEISSVTSFRTRVFDTPLRRFSFTRVPTNNPPAGVRAAKLGGSWAFIATPLRALADMVYLRSKVNWKQDGLAFLIEGLRIDEEDLSQLNTEDADEVMSSMRNKRTRNYLRHFLKEVQS